MNTAKDDANIANAVTNAAFVLTIVALVKANTRNTYRIAANVSANAANAVTIAAMLPANLRNADTIAANVSANPGKGLTIAANVSANAVTVHSHHSGSLCHRQVYDRASQITAIVP